MKSGKKWILLRSLLIAPLMVSLSLALPAGGASAAGEGGYAWTDALYTGLVKASALLYVDSRNELYCGTEVGLFCQTPGSAMWTQMSRERIKVCGLAWDGSSLYVGGDFVDSETPPAACGGSSPPRRNGAKYPATFPAGASAICVEAVPPSTPG